MPLFDYVCDVCQESQEVLTSCDKPLTCCGVTMRRLYSSVVVRDSRSITGKRNELWIGRMDEIHKRQTDRGERLRFVHPSEVL